MIRIIIFIFVSVLFSACEKQPGEGGTSTIEGKVYKLSTFQNATNGTIDTLYFQLDAKKDVFIIYSYDENAIYDDNFETDYNGRYRFDFLRKGEYTIYTYADSTDALGVDYDYPVFQHVKISANNKTYELEDFVIHE